MSYIDEVLEQVKQRDPNEPEYYQAVKESDLPKVYSSDLRERYKMLLAKKEKSFSNFKTSKENKGHE